MAVELEIHPTLLVGVGGTGSRIADRVLTQVNESAAEGNEPVRMIAFDTDEGDLAKLTALPRESRLQFSKPEQVYVTLDRNPTVSGDWFYRRGDNELTEHILGMSMIKGAGQMRMMTRLALHDSLWHGDMMATLESAISRLAVHNNRQASGGSVQIMMIGSLGGATGAGSFIQLALALRQAAKNRQVLAQVRGLFLMPDIFIRTGRVAQDEWENLLSNGYASLKELNAVNLRANLRELSSEFTFEYAPGQKATTGTPPFEEITFIDYENSIGGSMGQNLDAYVDMAARSAYLNIFTPLGSKIASQAINRKLQQQRDVNQGQVSVYTGMGIAAVNYPVQSTKRYLARRLVSENLKGDWTRLDVSFKDQMARYKKDAAAGSASAEEPERRASYLRDFMQLAKEDPPIPFFRRCHAGVFPIVEDPATFQKVEKPLHISYVDALLDYAKRQFWDDGEMNRVRKRSPLDNSSLLESDSMIDTVRREEYGLDRDWDALEANLQQRPADIFQNALITADNAAPEEWAPHHIQHYAVGQQLHPVAVRIFLYSVQDEMEKRLNDLDPRERKRKLFILANNFRSEEELQSDGPMPSKRSTPGIFDAATKASQGNILNRLLSSDKKAFAEDYVTYYNTSLTLMRTFADHSVEAKVLDQALAEVGNLVRTFEGLFDEIEAIGEGLETELENEIKRFEATGTVYSGSSYVYANRQCKEDAWRRLNDASTGISIDGAVNSQLCRSVYFEHRAARRERKKTAFNALRDLFEKSVVVAFGQRTIEEDYRAIYDMTVMDAIRAEYDVSARLAEERGEEAGLTAAQYTKQIVERTSKQSLPYLSLRRPRSDGSGVKFWAMHPDSRAAIQDEGEFIELFQSDTSGENALVEPQFDRYELICANLRVNLQLQHFSKLAIAADGADATAHAQSEGRMSAAYNARVQRMLSPENPGREGAEITPHVDKSWHLPGALPELHAELDEQIAASKAQGFVAALALDLIRFETDGKKRVARLATRGYGVKDGVDVVLADSHAVWDVYGGLATKAAALRSINAIWSKKRDEAAADSASHPVTTQLTDPQTLLRFLSVSEARDHQERARDTVAVAATTAWIGLIRELVEVQETTASPQRRGELVEKYIEDTRRAFFELVEAGGYSTEVVRAFRGVFDEAHDVVFAE